jgi:uncharacterized protein
MRRALAALPLLYGLFLLAIAVVQAAEPQFPPLTGRVNDRAGLLSERDERELEAALARFEAETTNQIVVVTLETLGGSRSKTTDISSAVTGALAREARTTARS